MKLLFENKNLFKQLIINIANEKGISEAIVEKDYYVSLILQEINKKCENLVFKGGTSLSKCHSIINRFSEDIDLSCQKKLTQGERKKIVHAIIDIVKNFGFIVRNESKINSGMDFNNFEIEYPILFNNNNLKNYVMIDLYFSLISFPIENKFASNFIYEYLVDNKLLDNIDFDELKPFQIATQSVERTFVDKVFALCDFYLNKEFEETSRYIYDLFKIIDAISFDEEFKTMIKNVRIDRQTNSRCISAQDKYDINKLLAEIIEKEAFKKDYEDNTLKIIFEDISYDKAISALEKIIDRKIF